jgi:hypothetical protein
MLIGRSARVHARAGVEIVKREHAQGDVFIGVVSGWFCTGLTYF